MKEDLYNRTVDRLRQIRPVSGSAAGLCDCIMDRIDQIEKGKRRFLTLRANETQWTIYKGFRVLMACAAVFLIAFFVFQQWQINQKLNRMEEELSNSHYYQSSSHYPVSNQQIQKILYAFQDSNIVFNLDSQQIDILQINRKSLNYMLKEIQKLRNENTGYREKLQQYYNDSVSFKD